MRIQRVGDRVLAIGGPRIITPRSAAASWWEVAGKTCVAAYQPKNAASYAASLTDLSGTGNDATEGATPTFDTTTGWYFAANKYLLTGVTPNQDYTLLYRYSGAQRSDGGVGSNTTAPRFYILANYGGVGNKPLWGYGPHFDNPISEQTAGVLGLAGVGRYFNGSALGSFAAQTFTTVNDIRIGHPVGVSAGAIYIQAVVLYSDTLSAAEVAIVSAAMAAL